MHGPVNQSRSWRRHSLQSAERRSPAWSADRTNDVGYRSMVPNRGRERAPAVRSLVGHSPRIRRSMKRPASSSGAHVGGAKLVTSSSLLAHHDLPRQVVPPTRLTTVTPQVTLRRGHTQFSAQGSAPLLRKRKHRRNSGEACFALALDPGTSPCLGRGPRHGSARFGPPPSSRRSRRHMGCEGQRQLASDVAFDEKDVVDVDYEDYH